MRAILTWHSIDPSGSPISVPSDVFRRQLEWLASGRVRIATVEELVALGDDVDAAALTFDDGFANFASEVAPQLIERRLPATLFIVAGRAGQDNRWRGRTPRDIPVLPLLGWDAIGRLQESGIALGAHTSTHPNLVALEPEELRDEFGSCVAEMERHLGRRPTGLAYPYGAVDDRVARVAAQHFKWACSTEFRAVNSMDSTMLLPRFDAWYLQDSRRLAGWGTPAFQVWAWCRRQGRRARAAARRLTAA